MSEVLDLLGRQLDDQAVQSLASQIGATPRQTTSAVRTALPALLAALQGNASTSGGASSLLSALDRDHDGSVLDDVAGFFDEGPTPADARSVSHIFGQRQGPVADAVAQRSGLDSVQVMRLLTMLAPIVLGALSRARQRNAPAGGGVMPGGAGPSGGLGDLLGAAFSGLQHGPSGSAGGLGGILGGLLGTAGAGSVLTDMLQQGRGGERQEGGDGGSLGDLLGGLLGGKH